MSYDLSFWKYKPNVVPQHEVVYEQLSAGLHCDAVEQLSIEQILLRVSERFSDWVQLDSSTYEHPKLGSFQIYATSQLFRVDCYGMNGEEMNRFIDIGNEFACPLYDPQVGARFDAESR